MTHVEHLDQLLREIDALQSRPFRRLARSMPMRLPARSTISAWIDQFVNLLVIR